MSASRPQILVVGDLGGRASRGVHEPESLAARPRLHVDRDEVEERMEQLGVEVQLPGGDRLPVRDIEHLEPDHLVDALGTFDRLRAIRRRLQDPKTFAEAADEIGATAEEGVEDDDRPEGVPLPEGLLDAAIEAAQEPRPAGDPADDSGEAMVENLARRLVAPHVVPRDDPRLPELLEAVDSGLGEHLLTVLRDPSFQRLEDAWTVVDQLTRRLETGAGLEIRLLDVTFDELAAAAEDGNVALGGAASEAPAPDLVLVLHRFGGTARDARILHAIADGLGANGLLVADFDRPNSLPEGEASAAWDALRAAHAASIALVVNRVPLRAPYGPRGASVERIAFDELAHGGRAARRLGSGAWTVALLYGRMALQSGGAPERLDATLEVDRLPLALVEEHGEVVQLPTAETFLGESDL
ncbi:MAG: type VI secretion system contractile sheath large subunit, partial [Planctomycetota bacterium]